MPFPESSRVVFQKNPLTEVICQLRFPTILEIASEDPAAFQKRIRASYPLYKKEDGGITRPQGIPKEIADALSQFGVIKPAEQLTHKFMTEDTSRVISLNREFVACTETQYTRWENFEKEIFCAKRILEDIYEPAFYTRIGLRYRDVIDRAILDISDQPWKALINPALIGMLGAEELYHQVQQIRSQVVISLGGPEDGQVTIRHGLENRENRQVYLIDADFSSQTRSEPDHVSRTLRRFNGLAGNLFRWSITELLRDALKPEEIN